MEKDMIFESFRNCVSDQKCKGCEWKACKVAQWRKVGIPLDLAFAVISLMADLLKEHEAVVRCRDCKHARRMCQPWNDLICEKNGQINRPDFYCADGERRTDDA